MKLVTFRFPGDITALEAGVLKRQITDTLAEEKEYDLLLDLRSVNYIDSSGLGVLISALKRTKENGGGAVKLLGVQPRVKAVLDVTRMTQVFDLVDVMPSEGAN